jgi:hypothetical protein
VPFDPRVRAVVDAHRKTFESLGCIVDQAEPDFAPAEVAFRVLRAWNTANSYGERFRAHPEAFKDTLTREIEEGLRLTGTDVARAEAAHGQIWRRFQAFLEKYEYFVLPTTQLPPFDVNTPYPTEIAGVKFDSYIDWMKSCWYISATGIRRPQCRQASRRKAFQLACRSSADSKRISASCSLLTHSNRRLASVNDIQPLRRRTRRVIGLPCVVLQLQPTPRSTSTVGESTSRAAPARHCALSFGL